MTIPQPANHRSDTTEGLGLLEEALEALGGARLDLELQDAAAARREVREARERLEDYLLPRYRSLEAPLLAVVGGSTGAGKSTLVNALVGRPVTRAGVIRPTTRQPLLVHHPADGPWFADSRVLPGLSRVVGRQAAAPAHPAEPLPATDDDGGIASLVLLAAEQLPAGLAVLDAPDIDSVSDDNRRLAGQLLAAADLWVFVTTANRYADAVPWRLLRDAADRDITVAVVLDRVPDEAAGEVLADLRRMLDQQGLGEAVLFVVPEVQLDGRGMLPPEVVEPVRRWLADLANDTEARSAVAARTLGGAVKQLADRMDGAAEAVRQQHVARDRLAHDVTAVYEAAAARILEATGDGTLLRGEVLARWQDFVGTGEFFRSLESTVGRVRDRIGAFFSGRPQPVATVEEAIETGLHAVVVDQAAGAAEEADERWRNHSAGRNLLGADDLGSPGPDFSERTAAMIRDWQGELLEMIRTEGADKRFTARMVSFGVNGVAVALMVVVFASTAGLTGLEVGIAGGSAIVGQKLLEAIFGEDAVRRLAKRARAALDMRCRALLAEDSQRFLERLDQTGEGTSPGRFEELGRNLRRLAAALAASQEPTGDGAGEGR